MISPLTHIQAKFSAVHIDDTRDGHVRYWVAKEHNSPEQDAYLVINEAFQKSRYPKSIQVKGYDANKGFLDANKTMAMKAEHLFEEKPLLVELMTKVHEGSDIKPTEWKNFLNDLLQLDHDTRKTGEAYFEDGIHTRKIIPHKRSDIETLIDGLDTGETVVKQEAPFENHPLSYEPIQNAYVFHNTNLKPIGIPYERDNLKDLPN